MASVDTGATRNDDEKKYDPDGFLSPFALESYFAYMHKHRLQHDGKLRDSENWKLGIPMARYMKSLWRHFFDVWKISDGMTAIDPDSGEKVDLETALNGVLFNCFGLLHETVKQKSVFKSGQIVNLTSEEMDQVVKHGRPVEEVVKGRCVR